MLKKTINHVYFFFIESWKQEKYTKIRTYFVLVQFNLVLGTIYCSICVFDSHNNFSYFVIYIYI